MMLNRPFSTAQDEQKTVYVGIIGKINEIIRIREEEENRIKVGP